MKPPVVRCKDCVHFDGYVKHNSKCIVGDYYLKMRIGITKCELRCSPVNWIDICRCKDFKTKKN